MISGQMRRKQGYTLTETLMALMIFTLLTLLAFSSLYFFNELQDMDRRSQDANLRFEKIHLYFQRQIETSEKIYVKDGEVFLQDMETSKYYDVYQLKPTGMLYRIKTTSYLKPIGGGESSQFEKGLKTFVLTALADEKGGFSGVFLLQVVFDSREEKCYEVRIAYPGSIENIISD